MKKLLIITLVLVSSSVVLSQEKTKPIFRFSNNFYWETFDSFELTNIDSIPDHNQLFGVGFDFQLDFEKWSYALVSNIGFSNKEEFGYESQLASYSAEIYAGRRFKVGKDVEIIPMIGYNFNGYNYFISNPAQNIDFNDQFEPTKRELLNSAHRISPRVVFRIFEDFQFSASYHVDLSKNRWQLESGKLLNAPKEDFSSFRFSLAYMW